MPNAFFTKFSNRIASCAGRPTAFLLAFTIILVWIVTGPVFGYSDTWQLVVNTGTSVITFLMVFLIQNTQNRDTKALQIKLDELIRVTEGAHTFLLDMEELDDHELEKIHRKYEALAAQSRKLLREGKEDTHVQDIAIEK